MPRVIQQLAAQHLHRHLAVEHQVDRAVHHPDRAAPHLALQAIAVGQIPQLHLGLLLPGHGPRRTLNGATRLGLQSAASSSASTTVHAWSIDAVDCSIADTEQYFSADSFTARSTAAGFSARPVTV